MKHSSVVTLRGKNHTLSILEDGSAQSHGDSELYEEGESFLGHLGHGEEWGEAVSEPRPMLFAVACCARVIGIAVGDLNSLVLGDFGTVFSCGGGWEGPLGLGDQASHACLQPVRALSSQRVVAVAAGAAHSLAVTKEGSLFTWGWGRYGQLGHGGIESETTPRLHAALSAIGVDQVAAGPTHSVATARAG